MLVWWQFSDPFLQFRFENLGRSRSHGQVPKTLDIHICCKAWGMDRWRVKTMSHCFGSQSRTRNSWENSKKEKEVGNLLEWETKGHLVLSWSVSKCSNKQVNWKVGCARCSTQLFALSMSQEMFSLQQVSRHLISCTYSCKPLSK